MRRYSSFEEVNKDLKLLKLQTEINTEELKLHFNKTKESLSPGNILTGFLGGLATSAVLIKLVTPIASFAIKKLLDKRK
tara:strand:+ start:215617 stop:215853 length:237 start_codon:yes stop_codon:yes gene_type:complete